MKRPAGLVIAAVLLILLSAKELVFAGLLTLSGFVAPHQATTTATPPPPHWIGAFLFGFAAFCVLLSAWGITTAVGVLRLRRWARYSILIIGGCLAFFGLAGAASSALFFLLPFPLPPSADAAQVHMIQSFFHVFIAIMIAYELALGAIGAWWLVYFNRARMRELFAQGMQPQEALERPFAISILAVLNMAGAVICLIYVFVPLPAMAFGIAFHGWGKALFYLAFGAAIGATGWGLWTRQEWGRRLALGLLAVGALNSLACLLRPSALTAYTLEVNQKMGIQAATLPANYQSRILVISFAMGVLLMALVVWVLIHYRESFIPSNSRTA